MGELVLVAVGDINIQQRQDPREVFSRVQPDLARADVRIGNLEMCLCGSREVIREKFNWTHSDPRVAEALRSAGFQLVTVVWEG